MSEKNQSQVVDRDFEEDNKYSEYEEKYGDNTFERIQKGTKRPSGFKENNGKKPRRDF